MSIDRKKFFDSYRVQFHPTLTQTQVDGYNAMLNYWETTALQDLRWLAYALATAYHETGELMAPVREGFCKTDAGSIQAVTDLYNRGGINQNYAVPEANGNSYFGRGLVQLTWGDNYKKMGKALGMGNQLYDNPSLALDLDTSVKILFKGMIDGLFARYGLAHFFNATTTDWVDARQIINGTDQADAIADYAQRFKACLA